MNLIFILVLTVVSVLTAASPDTRLVGGAPATITEYPFVVSITYSDPEAAGPVQRCVGSLISSWHVLTSAYCFTDSVIEYFKVRAGSANSLSGGSVHDIMYVIEHPEYKKTPRTADIAIVVLTKYITMTDSIRIVYIPPQETYIPDGYSVRALSWGYAGEDGPKLETLNAFDTNILPLQQCKDAFADDDNVRIYDQVLCTQAQNRSVCHGDTGAPLVINEALVGVTSYFKTCDDSTPDVFSRVDRHTGWILQEAVPPYGWSGTLVRVAGSS